MGRTSVLLTVTSLSALGFLLVGYDNGVLGGVNNGPEFLSSFNHPSSSVIGTITAIYDVGCCIGAVATAIFGEALGRRKTIMIGAVFMLAGAGAQAGVSNVGGMIAARIVSGLGMGAINAACPVLLSEFVPKASRGRYLCAQLTALNAGIAGSGWITYAFTNYVTGSKSWRIPVALQAVFILPIFLLAYLCHESPRWLVSHDQHEKAILVIAELYSKATDDEEVVRLFEDIRRTVEVETVIVGRAGSWRNLLLGRDDSVKSRRRFFIACAIQGFQQLGGINGIIYYSGTVLAVTGLNPHDASLVSGCLFTWFFVASFIPWFLIDRVGRRPLFLVCISLMACCFAAEAGLIWKVQQTASKSAGAGAAAVLFVYMGLFTTGFQATTWGYSTEINTLLYRQKGVGIASGTNWIINFAIVQMTPPALENIGYRYYIIFAILNAAFVPVIYFFFPETRALSLEEIDGLFSNPGFAGSNEDLNPVPIPDLVESSARTSGEEKGEPKV